MKDDVLGWKRFKYKSPVYELDEDGEYTTLFGKKCSLIEGKWDWFDNQILERDIQDEIGVLRDFYYKDDSQPTFHNIVYLDIEIQLLGSLTPSYIQAAPAELTSLALTYFEGKEKKRICWIVDTAGKLENKTIGINTVITCYSERDMINKFLKKWKEIDPTILIGYNSDFFDIPYLYCRILKIFGEETANLLSPIKKVINNPAMPDKPITIGGVSSLDFMRLHKKYITREEPSYTLNNIGLKYAKLGKIEYSGNLDELLAKDPEKYIEYNIRDVEILEELEKNLQFVQLTVLISHLCHTPYESIYYNTVLNEGAILTYLKRKKIVVHNKPTTINKEIKELNEGDLVNHQRGTPTIEGEIHSIDGDFVVVKTASNELKTRELKTIKKKEGYAGGYLLNPEPGVYRWLSDYDYSSYYPSCIRSLNLGIETLIGRIVIENPTRNLWWGLEDLRNKDPELELEFEVLSKETYKFSTTKVTVEKLIKTIETKNWSISANGVCFDKSQQSISASVLADWFEMRKVYKHDMEKAYKSGDETLGKLYDSQQQAFKIMLNSLYGAYAINSWRFTDGYKILSSAITCTCQRLLQETIKYANEVIDEKYLDVK